MTEELLSFIWQHRLWGDIITTIKGEKVEVIHPGYKNTDAGPDFFNAKIKVDDILWAGNVEIHKKNSDWVAHKHHNDSAYETVILHVIGEYDKTISHTEKIPTAILPVADYILDNYTTLKESKQTIVCKDFSPNNNLLGFELHRLCVDRMEMRTKNIKRILEETENNWNETFYRILARYFGMKKNALPFEMLAKSLPLSIIAKHKNDWKQIEAMLLGQAGFLDDTNDEYSQQLSVEYQFLKQKYQLQPLENSIWKFAKLRPINFPTVRIAQLASLIHHSHGLFTKTLENPKGSELEKLLKCTPSTYWKTHYQLGKESISKSKEIGKTAIHTLIINSIAPMIFVYGHSINNHDLQERAIQLLEELPTEKNNIITLWKDWGYSPKNAFETQALLQLYNEYCEQKKCLQCHLGGKIVKEPRENYI